MGKKVKAVIFDQDGLMFDTERLAMEAWYKIGARYGVPVDEDFMREMRGSKSSQIKEAFLARYGNILEDYDAFREEKRRYSYDWIHQHGVPVKKGLKELLQYLKEHHIPMAVATGSSLKWTQMNMADAGIEEYFESYVCADMVTEAKPNPAIFKLAAAELKREPSECLVIEDSFNGIRAAAAGGFLSVMVPDLSEPTPEIAGLFTMCCCSLLDVISLFKNGSFELERE